MTWKLQEEWVWHHSGESLLIEHSADPYVAKVDVDGDEERAWLLAATAYLGSLGGRVPRGLADALTASLNGSQRPASGWSWRRHDPSNPETSYVVTRRSAAAPNPSSTRTAVLVASPQPSDGSALEGLAICASIRSTGDGKAEVRVLGCNLNRGLMTVTPSDARPMDCGAALQRQPSLFNRFRTAFEWFAQVFSNRREWPSEWGSKRELSPLVMKQDPVSKFGRKFLLFDHDSDHRGLDLALVSDPLGLDQSTSEDDFELTRPSFEIHLTPSDDGASTQPIRVPRDMSALSSADDRVWGATAYYHALRSFEKLDADGYAAASVLRHLTLPVRIYVRGFVNTVIGNAAVQWVGHPHKIDTPSPDRRAPVQIVFEKDRSNRMSICCDARWFWHEFSHVLLAGATGSMELPFCHSVGDALAAITQDAASALRDEPGDRGDTFPFVRTGHSDFRRHDRRPEEGLGWYCSRYGPAPSERPGNPLAYDREQIMSSTLFTLYLKVAESTASGGTIDESTLQAASDRVTALVFQAIALLGPARLSPAAMVEDFMAALARADQSMGDYVAPSTGATFEAGSASTLIRQAFAAHGLTQVPRGAG